MEFPYRKVISFFNHRRNDKILPWINVGLYNPEKYNHETNDKVIYTLGLIDSGSELTIIDREIGEELGYEIEKGKRVKIIGVGGGQISGYLHSVGFQIDDLMGKEESIIYRDYVVFAETKFQKTMPQQTAIWGTKGFFNQLAVGFRYPNSIFVERGE
ncbi:MAG: hypothetical protein HY005_03595 [Candidatus Staskawiczbacteria bacterium]|nr:hypothetical protein [Candidatus Staskawiczbacteria bacterium]